MKVPLAVAVLLVAAIFTAVGISKFTEYRYDHSVEGLAASAKLNAANEARNVEQNRVYLLADDHCESRVIALKKQNSASRITTPSEIPAQLLSDLHLCVERGILRLWDKDELEQLGLMPLLSDTSHVNGT